MGEEREGDVTVPAIPASHLVVEPVPTSPLASSNPISTRQRLPATFASSSSVVPWAQKTV